MKEFKLNESIIFGIVTSYIVFKVTELSPILAGIISQNPQLQSYYIRTSIELIIFLLLILVILRKSKS